MSIRERLRWIAVWLSYSSCQSPPTNFNHVTSYRAETITDYIPGRDCESAYFADGIVMHVVSLDAAWPGQLSQSFLVRRGFTSERLPRGSAAPGVASCRATTTATTVGCVGCEAISHLNESNNASRAALHCTALLCAGAPYFPLALESETVHRLSPA